jgi:hypothetical protein
MNFSEAVKALETGLWAYRKTKSWREGTYIYLDEDGDLVYRTGDPGDASVEVDYQVALEDFKGRWYTLDPKKAQDSRATLIEQALVPMLQAMGGTILSKDPVHGMFSRYYYDHVKCVVEGGSLVIGYYDQTTEAWARVFARGEFEWLAETQALAKSLPLISRYSPKSNPPGNTRLEP